MHGANYVKKCTVCSAFFVFIRIMLTLLFQRQENSKDCLPSSLKVHPLSLI